MAQLTTRKLSELFEDFLKTYQDKSKNYKYRERISELIASGGRSVVIDYDDMIHFNADLCDSLLQDPDRALQEFRKAAYETMSAENAPYADKVRRYIQVRIAGITDRVPLRKVDTSYLDKMIAFSGMVVRTSELRPLLQDAAFVCPNEHVTMVAQEGQMIRRPVKCESCNESRSLELDQKRSKFIDSQNLRVQELPEELPPGQLPRFFDVDLEGDIVNTARPGDRLILTGIVRAEPDLGAPGQVRMRAFRSKIESNFIEILGKEPGQIQITKEDEILIRNIAKSQGAYQKLVNSIAPAIVGHDAVKEAILLLLCGSPQTTLPDNTKLRGDINVLLVGDPGVAKSEMLKFAAQVAPRGIFASGRGSSLDHGQQVIVRRAGTTQMAKIGELVDNYYLPGASGAFVPVSDLECLSYNSSTGKIEWAKVGFVYRHRHEGSLTRLTLQTGREVVVTDDHSVYAFKQGRLRPVETRYLKPGDCLAIPGRLPLSYESGLQRSLFTEDLLTNLRLARLLGYYVAEGYLHEGKKRGKESYRIEFVLNSNENEIVSEIRDCAQNLFNVGVTVTKKKDSNGITVSISNKSAFLLFRDVLSVARGARVKRVPAIVFNMPRELQLEFLRTYLEGDRGGTSSPLLMSDLLYLVGQSNQLLAKFVRKKPSTGRINGREFHGGPYFQLKAPCPYNMKRPVRLLPPPLREALSPFESVLASQKQGQGFFTDEYTRLTGKVLKRLMSGRRLRRVNLLRMIESRSISTITDASLAFNFGRKNAKQMLRRCKDYGLVSLEIVDRQTLVSITAKGREALSAIAEIESIVRSDLQFAQIQKVERVDSSSEFVYDLSVPGTENFIAGFGGILCHNTAAGLSAAVIREKNVLMLEAGVVVLADQGIACIDEFDKMRPEDRSALHEQMEQQTCTIAKGGIYATLNARTAILAAINPVLGKYDAYQNLTDNINLPIPLLTRFDLIFVIRDTPTPAQDDLLATHILEVHRKRGFTTAPPVQFDLLKKYITFVKKITPTLTREAEERLKEYYLSLRRSTTEGQIGATPRTLESLIRTATARARLLLREQVTEDDALAAISLMKRMVEDVLTDAATQTKGDFGVLFGKPVGEKNKLSAAMQVFKQLEGEGAQRRPVEGRLFREELIKSAKFTDEDADKLITNMLKEGIIYESKTGFFRRVGS